MLECEKSFKGANVGCRMYAEKFKEKVNMIKKMQLGNKQKLLNAVSEIKSKPIAAPAAG